MPYPDGSQTNNQDPEAVCTTETERIFSGLNMSYVGMEPQTKVLENLRITN